MYYTRNNRHLNEPAGVCPLGNKIIYFFFKHLLQSRVVFYENGEIEFHKKIGTYIFFYNIVFYDPISCMMLINSFNFCGCFLVL